jgi:large subunit ribosomal protein L18
MVRKEVARAYRKGRIRKKIRGTPERPRLSVYRSLDHLYAQIVDDLGGRTLLGISTLSKEFVHRKEAGNVKGARELGKILAKKALEKKITDVVFDRGGFLYHGRVKAFAEGAREGGLKF